MITGIGNELVANSSPRLGVDQSRMLAGIELSLVGDLTGVDRVGEQAIEMPA